MKIVAIKTFLMHAAPPQTGGWAARNWLFVKVITDEGIYGIGEASGWPRVVETAIHDLEPLLVGEDPFHIERLWNKMLSAIMGHGMTGIVGGGAMSGVEMALWDIKGKALEVPVWNLLGGKMRDRVRIYAHAHDAPRARELVDRGYTALKTGGIENCVEAVDSIRREVGLEVDLMVDVHGPPWMTTADAISMGKKLEPVVVDPADIEARVPQFMERAGHYFQNWESLLENWHGKLHATIAELESASRQSLPFVMVLADDEAWGITLTGHEKKYGRGITSELGPIDFVMLGRSLGALGVRVDSPDGIEPAIREALTAPQPTVIHVPIVKSNPAH